MEVREEATYIPQHKRRLHPGSIGPSADRDASGGQPQAMAVARAAAWDNARRPLLQRLVWRAGTPQISVTLSRVTV
jgi:hypothetical protein